MSKVLNAWVRCAFAFFLNIHFFVKCLLPTFSSDAIIINLKLTMNQVQETGCRKFQQFYMIIYIYIYLMFYVILYIIYFVCFIFFAIIYNAEVNIEPS